MHSMAADRKTTTFTQTFDSGRGSYFIPLLSLSSARYLGFSARVCAHSRCAGMILTLISLVELDGVFRGLYFFSSGGLSKGPELHRLEEGLGGGGRAVIVTDH